MDRKLARKPGTLLLLCLLALAVIQSGCASAFLAPIYLLKGTEVDPMFKKEVKAIPKESKIVVVCRGSMNLYGAENPSRDMSAGLTLLMKNKLEKRKFQWVPYELVEASFDEEALSLETFTNIGKKVGADYIIGVDMDSFQTNLSSQFYQGKAKVHVQLVNVNDNEVIARKSLPEFVYPPTPVPINDKPQVEFQKQFTVKLANEVGTLFYPYNPHDKYALDNDFPER
ncbi:MAG: hypothetical protein Q4G68_10915 [Planctomycetia bacterium]|nr:hypothetical protein [Planctomycetia bacterium]